MIAFLLLARLHAAAAGDVVDAAPVDTATPATPTTPAGAPQSSTPAPPTARLLDLAEAALADGRLDDGRALLDALPAPLSLADLSRQLELHGVAAALGGDAAQAERHFVRLLVVDPDHALSYTRSPQVTFPFEAARRARAQAPALQVRLSAPLVLSWGEPVEVSVHPTANPLQLVQALEVCVRDKAAGAPPSCQAASPTSSTALSFAALPAPSGADAGATGVAVVSLRGFDDRRNVVLEPAAVEVPVGFSPPPAWYESPWLWGGVGAGAAVLAAGVAVAVAVVSLQPQEVGWTVVVE